jgi:pimeloyl-ACP methyl ester carboxylesterase
MEDSAISVLGTDYTFPNKIEGLPEKLSDFKELKIGHFTTEDDVRLAYWSAGQGRPLILVPAWSSNGAEYINVMYLLSKHYRVYVLDPRNQGLSQCTEYGNSIYRFSKDLKEFVDHLGVQRADFCGWSMGVSVLWGYIDLFGTRSMRKLAFVDQAPSIYSHADWSEQERLDAGAFTSSPERMIASYSTMTPTNMLISATNVLERAMAMDSVYYRNSVGFAGAVINTNMDYAGKVLFDHSTNDWRGVVRHKINVPTAIFSGEWSDWLRSQYWMKEVIPEAELHVYTKSEQGDHFLMVKNPVKFVDDLHWFLEK